MKKKKVKNCNTKSKEEKNKEKVSKAQKGHSQCGPCGHGRYRESLAVQLGGDSDQYQRLY